MARKISSKSLDVLTIIPYDDARKSLKTGDLIFCSGRYWISHVIQFFSKSTFSHVGIIYRDEELDRVLILESEIFYGVRLAPLSKYLKDYHGRNKPYKGRMLVAQLNPNPSLDRHQEVVSFGMDELTRPYDNYEIFRILLRALFKTGKKEKNRSYICSELVNDCFSKINIKFKPRNTYISPDEIWRDDRVEYLKRIL